MNIAPRRAPKPVRQGDEVKQVSVREATARAHLKTALGGNARALADVTRQIALADASRAAELAEDHAFWRAYRVHTLAQIAQAKSNGEPEPLILPHPEDIVIREGEPVRFKGPTDLAALKRYEETCRLRDHMFLWEELDERRRRKQARKGLPSPDGAALLFMDMLERGLPLRMQLTEAERYRHEISARRMTKRELLKKLHAGWRALGRPCKRGTLPPSFDDAVKALKPRMGLLNALHSGELDADRIINGDIDERMEDVLVRLGFPRGHLTGG